MIPYPSMPGMGEADTTPLNKKFVIKPIKLIHPQQIKIINLPEKYHETLIPLSDIATLFFEINREVWIKTDRRTLDTQKVIVVRLSDGFYDQVDPKRLVHECVMPNLNVLIHIREEKK